MEQSIRVSARGEFGQLTRGLKQLRGDLKNVTDEISRGARGGGVFDDSQLRALDLFKRRFSETLREIDREFEKQNDIVEELYSKLEKAQQSERSSIRKTIQDREKQLDVLRKQIMEQERLFELQSRQIGVPPTPPAQPGTRPGAHPGAHPGTGTPLPGAGSSMPGNPQFSQLLRGIKQLQHDLKDVNGEIDKGARKGGIFDEKNLRTLDIFKRRFQDTMQEVDDEFQRQNEVIDKLHEKMANAQGAEKDAIAKNIQSREKELDVLRQQLYTIEKIYGKRTSEASGYGSAQPPGSGANQDELDEAGNSSLFGKFLRGKMLSRGMGLGKGALALAGIGGIGSMLSEAYQAAYSREVNSLDLAQRMRGQGGRSGTAVDMYDSASEVGRRDGMGYTAQESWQFLDQYTRQAGAINTDQQLGLMKFGRGYGLSTSEVAHMAGTNRQVGGATSPQEFADAIAGSVGTSGMTPRILEVMETNNTLLQQMNTTLKDGSSRQILAYQTTLDKIGLANGMSQLTGAQGANLIGGLGGIFQPGEDNWKWMGIRALQSYNPEKYGNMDLFDLEQSYEDGLMNADNIPAMAEYIRKQTGGDAKLEKRIMQKWLTDGGFAATKREASDFYDATDGLRVFNPDQIEAMKNGSIDSGAKYDDERASEGGQNILDVNAQYTKALEGIGSEFIGVITSLKEIVTSGVESLGQFVDALDAAIDGMPAPDWVKELGSDAMEFTEENPWVIAAGIGGAALGKKAYDKWKANKARTGTGGAINPSDIDPNVDANGRPRNPTPDVDAHGNPRTTTPDADLPPRSATHGGGSKKLPKIAKGLGWLGLLLGAGDVAMNWDDYNPMGDSKEWGWNWASMFDPGLMLAANADPIGDQVSKDIASGTISTTAGSSYYNNPAMQEYLKNKEKERQDLYAQWGNPSAVDSSGVPELTPEQIDTLANYLAGLKPAGDSEIGKMSEEDYQRFVDMPKKVTTDVSGMTTEGSEFFQISTKEHKDKLQQIYNEHNGLKDFFTSMFNPVIEGFKFMFTTVNSYMNGTAGSNPSIGGNFDNAGGFDVRGMGDSNIGTLNSKLGGVLSGRGAEFMSIGQRYGINPTFLAALAMHETGNGTSSAARTKNNVGGMMGANGLMSFGSVTEGIDAMASNLYRNYISQGLTTVGQIQQKYAPVGAANDPTNLNSNWTKGVNSYMNSMGVATPASSGGFFSNWQSRVTSRFGDFEDFRSKPHGGLDINGEQGDKLEALREGTISFIKHDDGSELDEDGKANTRSGGTEVGIKMADGSTYYYSHMSKVNSGLQVGQKVNAGDYIGNLGGDPGKPGSGSSTTGSHLHLGYMDSNGNLMNPEQLLRQLNIGDSDIGKMMSQMPLENRQQAPSEVKKLEITVNLKGEGAAQLNQLTESQLRRLIKQVFTEENRNKLLTSPSKAGYAP